MGNCLICGMRLDQTGHTCAGSAQPPGGAIEQPRCNLCNPAANGAAFEVKAVGLEHIGGEIKTLRDEFAMEAMKKYDPSADNFAFLCYRLADKMMEERGRARK